MSLLNRDDDDTRAINYLFADREDFDILLIPIHTRLTDVDVPGDAIWRIGQHWMLGILDRRGYGGRECLTLYDPFNHDIDPNVRKVLRRVLNVSFKGYF